MNADMKWLDNPEVFRVNQLEAHSDHTYYESYEALEKKENALILSLNGQWEFVSVRMLRADRKTSMKRILMRKTLIRSWCRAILNWLDMIRSATSIPCTHGREKNTAEAPTVWRAPETEPECSAKLSIIR